MQVAQISQTLIRFSAVLGHTTQDVQSIQTRMSSSDEKLDALEKQQAEVVKLQARLVNGLGSQESGLHTIKHEVERLRSVSAEHSHVLAAVKVLEGRLDIAESRAAEDSHRTSTRVEALADKLAAVVEDGAKGQRVIRKELGEQASEAARRLGTLEGALDVFRNQFSEVRDIASRLQELDNAQTSLQTRLDDILVAARSQIEHHITSSALRLHQHIEAEAKQVESNYENFSDRLRQRAEQERHYLSEEYKMQLQNAANDMKGSLDCEINHSCRELSLMLSTWQEGLLSATDAWTTYLENRQYDEDVPPHMEREAASGFSDALRMLSEQLSRLRGSSGNGFDFDERWLASSSPSGRARTQKHQRNWKPPGCSSGSRGQRH
jgi:chromosome segregation ATPase